VAAIRQCIPEGMPLFVRVSSTEWVEDGWQIEDSILLARRLRECGADLLDCSSGGNVPRAKIPAGPGYQTVFSERIRREAEMRTGAVGMITSPAQADHIIRSGQADIVLLARELLRDPYWPLRAARELGQAVSWPVQYLRAAPPDSTPRREFVPPVPKDRL
jgi:2,4-dienoyl-CoA reductase-like NADH-dependent reductase (Old Yellow Enzyme family)